MSADEGDDGGPGNREVAYRLFAAEFEDADFSSAESDEERAPNYVVTPTGARVNRLFVVGVLTEVESVGEDILRARVVDPTGAVVVYAGQYQPDAQAFFERAEPPAFLAVSGKARTFQPEDSDVIYTSLRPESVNEVDAETRDRWTVRTAERTLDRIGTMAAAKQSGATGDALRAALDDSGVDPSLSAGVPLALDHYGTTGSYLSALKTLALDATRVVAGEREEAGSLALSPGEGSDADIADLATIEVEAAPAAGGDESASDAADMSETAAAADEPSGTEATASPDDATPESATEATASTEDTTTASETGSESATATTADSSAGTADTSTSAASAEPTADSPPSAVDSEAEADPVDETVEPVESATDDGADSEATTTDDAESPASDTIGEGPADDDIGDFEPGEFELDEETREEVESEYGTDFQSGSEVEEPGSADIDTPDPEELAAAEETVPETAAESDPSAASAAAASESPGETDAASGPDADADGDGADAGDEAAEPDDTSTDSGDAAAEDVDLEDAVMDAMAELDDGDGADRDAVIEAVVDRTGADTDAVEDAVQSALMSGRCYEPDDATLKSI